MRLLLTALFLATVAVLGLQSCSEDFTVSAPYRQITVVAGILDMDDTAHYIRIQKAFMDENKSAITMSKEPDSSFYSNLKVTLVEFDSAQTKALDSVVLYRVDVNNEGYRKLEPISDQQFFTSPNYAYKFRDNEWKSGSAHQLSPRRWYRLFITNNNTSSVDTSGYVGVVNTDSTRTFDGFYMYDFQLKDYQISFSRTTPSSIYKLKGFMPRNGRQVEGYIKFIYVNKNIATNTKTRDTVVFAFDSETDVTKAGSTFELSTQNNNFYGFLASAIPPAPENVERYFDSCEVYTYAASPEIYYYTIINQGQTGGLTGDNIQPNYTNFSGSNVIGVLGSRGKRVYRNAAIEKVTLDSMMINPTLVNLRIKGRSDD